MPTAEADPEVLLLAGKFWAAAVPVHYSRRRSRAHPALLEWLPTFGSGSRGIAILSGLEWTVPASLRGWSGHMRHMRRVSHG